MISVPENSCSTGAERGGASKRDSISLVQMGGRNPRENGLFGSQEDGPWKKWPAKAEPVLEAALPWCEALSGTGFKEAWKPKLEEAVMGLECALGIRLVFSGGLKTVLL